MHQQVAQDGRSHWLICTIKALVHEEEGWLSLEAKTHETGTRSTHALLRGAGPVLLSHITMRT